MIIVSESDYNSATSRQLVDLKCENCGKIFQKRKKDVVDSRRENSHAQVNFCSTKCLLISKGKQNHSKSLVETVCGWCGKEMIVPRSVILKSKSGKVFCSVSCGTKYSNSNSVDKYTKISKLFTIYGEINCKYCKNPFKKKYKNNQFCSVECYKNYTAEHKKPLKPIKRKSSKSGITKPRIPRTKTPRTKEWCAETVKNFRANGIIPTVRTMSTLTKTAKKLFGGWNKMMIELGYTDIFVGPKRKLKSKDEHKCDSASEVIIDNFLYQHGIIHERSKNYPSSKKNCDFYLPEHDLWIEFAGLCGYDYYDKTMQEKIEISKLHKLNLIIITKQDLYKNGCGKTKEFLCGVFKNLNVIK